jgi:hypothetical protein
MNGNIDLDHINLSEYPIDQPDSAKFKDLIARKSKELSATGLINLENFLTQEGVNAFRTEVYDRVPDAYYSVHGAQAYFNDFPGGIPDNVVGSETYCMGHHVLQGSTMDALYRWEPTRQFIAALTENTEVFLHEDPTNALVIQIYKPGCWTGWHFDRAIFTTIINLGEPEAGGVFECAPDIRTEDDPGYDDVRDVLLNRSDQVQRYNTRSGSLTLMLGRYSIHRVTKVEAEADRISLVLKYETKPGVHISAADRKWIYGPSAPGLESPELIADN